MGSEKKESNYWTVYTNGNGYSNHIELTHMGTYAVWESKIIRKELSREESYKLCMELSEVWNGK